MADEMRWVHSRSVVTQQEQERAVETASPLVTSHGDDPTNPFTFLESGIIWPGRSSAPGRKRGGV